MADSSRISGWLSKWINGANGYVKMWFVLDNGILFCHSTQNGTCQGEIQMCGAVIDYDETRKFVVSRDGEAFHLKADDEESKSRWVHALVSTRDTLSVESLTGIGSKIQQCGRTQDLLPINTLQHEFLPFCPLQKDCLPISALNQDRHPMNALEQESGAQSTPASMTWSLDGCSFNSGDLEAVKNSNGIISDCCNGLGRSISTLETSLKNGRRDVSDLSECISRASAMAEACKDYITLVESISIRDNYLEQGSKLEKIVETLMQAQSNSSRPSEDESSEYFDCWETNEGNFTEVLQVYHVGASKPSGSPRRTRVPDRPNVSDNLWSILKNSIGVDLSKIPLPVSFAEPLSLLQRLSEDYEYANILDKAAGCSDPAEQMAYVCAFISSSYSTTIGRSGKPFNPLLGETYECDRQSDLGWRSIAEQVSHHPPVAAVHCEGKEWEVYMDQSMKTKFKGTTLTVVPLGECHLKFKNGNRYAWKKPNTSIHNIIVGKLWVEQEGDVEIKCFTTPITCKLTFMSSGWFGETFSVKGVVKDVSGNAVFDVAGKYTTEIEFRPAGTKDPGTVIWRRTEPPPDSAKYYHFTLLACQLNEMEDGVAPTDSRHRPDQRLMEEGKFDEANATKKKLEEFQRTNKKENWTPSWFKLLKDPDTNKEVWIYQGEYWQCKAKKDWSRCPAYIFKPPDT